MLGGPFRGPDPLLLEARGLAPLSFEYSAPERSWKTAETWWRVAEAMFLESHPQPEADVELRSLFSTAGKRASHNDFSGTGLFME
jgi:hypothetical protein